MKKPGKPAVVKVMKDPKVPRDDIYKSSTIHTNEGEPPGSVSRPTPRGKQIAAKPITKGKLLRPGGPGGGPSKLASRPAQPRNTGVVSNQTPAAGARAVPQPLAGLNGSSHGRNTSSSSSARAPPPPPPMAATQASQDPTCRALYDFAGQSQGEMSVKKGEVVIIVRKEPNGKFRLN
jgi:myosin-1